MALDSESRWRLVRKLREREDTMQQASGEITIRPAEANDLRQLAEIELKNRHHCFNWIQPATVGKLTKVLDEFIERGPVTTDGEPIQESLALGVVEGYGK